jgi:hypothetical protein
MGVKNLPICRKQWTAHGKKNNSAILMKKKNEERKEFGIICI